MNLAQINKEIVRIGRELGLKVIDDAEFISFNTLWIEQLYKSKMVGNKDNSKQSFYAVLNLYDLDAQKNRIYETGEALSDKLLSEFLIDNEEYQVKIEKKKEELAKVSADTGKLYQYSYTFVINTNKIIKSDEIGIVSLSK